jgi:hypothetical protein
MKIQEILGNLKKDKNEKERSLLKNEILKYKNEIVIN